MQQDRGQSNLTPLRAIKAHCKICIGEVVPSKRPRDCPHPSCSLYPYRTGHNPLLSRRTPLQQAISHTEPPQGATGPMNPPECENPQLEGGFSRPVGYLKAIRAHCLWCCNDSFQEVRSCPADTCPLWRFRFGRRPKPQPRT